MFYWKSLFNVKVALFIPFCLKSTQAYSTSIDIIKDNKGRWLVSWPVCPCLGTPSAGAQFYTPSLPHYSEVLEPQKVPGWRGYLPLTRPPPGARLKYPGARTVWWREHNPPSLLPLLINIFLFRIFVLTRKKFLIITGLGNLPRKNIIIALDVDISRIRNHMQ